MKFKHFAILATMLVAGHAWALSAYEKNHSCNNEVGGCSEQGGGGGVGNSSYVDAFIAEGSLWELFSDSEGGFTIETDLSTGKKSVHIGEKAAFLIKPPPANSNMKRSALVYGAMAPAQSAAQAKQKADAKKAQEAAAAKAAADAAAAAANKAAAVYNGPAIGTQPAGGGMVLNARKKP